MLASTIYMSIHILIYKKMKFFKNFEPKCHWGKNIDILNLCFLRWRTWQKAYNIKDSIEEIKERVFIMPYLLNPPKVILSTQPYGFYLYNFNHPFHKNKKSECWKINSNSRKSFIPMLFHAPTCPPLTSIWKWSWQSTRNTFWELQAPWHNHWLNALSDIIVEMEEKIEEVKSMFFTTYL